MWVVKNGKAMIMVQDTRHKMKWVYIPEKKWDSMTVAEKERYI
jgi:hypothetical protein